MSGADVIQMARAARMAIAGALMAALVSSFAFLAFPPGLRLEIGVQEKAPADAAFISRSQAHEFHLAGADDMSWISSLGPTPLNFSRNVIEWASLPPSQPLQPLAKQDLITQESMAYLTSSAALTALSWAEEDAVIPLYGSALASVEVRLRAEVSNAASARASVEKAWSIAAISEYILQGRSYPDMPLELKRYASDVGLANFERLLTTKGDERFAASANLTRFESSVIWANYATSFEMERDVSCLAVLGFAIAANEGPWLQLSSFYRGLLGRQAFDCSALSSAAVSVFGHELNEEELLDPTLLNRFSGMISRQSWSFPFPILFSEQALGDSISRLTGPGGSVLEGVSELRDSLVSGGEDRGAGSEGMAGVWLDLLLLAPWVANSDRAERAIAGSYLTLASSHTAGVSLELAAADDLVVESNPTLYSSLDAFLVGTYRYIASCVGASERVTALALLAHDLLTKLTRGTGISSPYVSVDARWAEEFSSLLQIAGLCPTSNLNVQLGQRLDRVTVALTPSDVGGRTGMLYAVSEAFDQD